MPLRAGFTLLEALLAIATLAIMAAAISLVSSTALQSIDSQSSSMLLQGRLRSQMEALAHAPVASLSRGSNTVSVVSNGSSNAYVCTWSVIPVDMDGDANVEPDARQVTVSLGGESLTMILVDHNGQLEKL